MKLLGWHLVNDKTLSQMYATKTVAPEQQQQDNMPADVIKSQIVSGKIAVPNSSEVITTKGLTYLRNMTVKNGTVYGLITTREHAVIRRGWVITPASQTRRDVEVASFVTDTITNLKTPFIEILHNIYQAWYFGWSLQQKQWERVDGGKRYVITDMLSKPVDNLEIHTDENGTPIKFKKKGYTADAEKLYDVNGFLYASFEGSANNPYGTGLLERCYWHDFFMRNTWKFWGVYLERFGNPVTKATAPMGVSAAERQAMLDIMEKLQTRTGIVLPQDWALEFMESSRSDAAIWDSFCAEHRMNIQLIILGQTLTSTPGASGSKALGEVQSTVKDHIIDSDCDLLFNFIQKQFVIPLVDMNYSGIKKYPVISSPVKEDINLESTSRILTSLFNMGFEIPESYVRNTMGIPAPRDNEPVLSNEGMLNVDPKSAEGAGSKPPKETSSDDSSSGDSSGESEDGE